MTDLRKYYINACQIESINFLSTEELKKKRQDFLNPPPPDLLTYEDYQEIYKIIGSLRSESENYIKTGNDIKTNSYYLGALEERHKNRYNKAIEFLKSLIPPGYDLRLEPNNTPRIANYSYGFTSSYNISITLIIKE